MKAADIKFLRDYWLERLRDIRQQSDMVVYRRTRAENSAWIHMATAISDRIVTLTVAHEATQEHAMPFRDDHCPSCRRRRDLIEIGEGQRRWVCVRCAEHVAKWLPLVGVPPGSVRQYDLDANGNPIAASIFYS